MKRYGVLHPYPLHSLWRSSPGWIRNFPVDVTASRFLWDFCKMPQKSSFFVIFGLATTVVACATQYRIVTYTYYLSTCLLLSTYTFISCPGRQIVSWPRQGSQNSLDNPEFQRKSWISWVWGFEVVHAKGSFEVALPPNASISTSARRNALNPSWSTKTSGRGTRATSGTRTASWCLVTESQRC